MKDLGVKFPHIVLAQSKLETSNFRSAIFRENHNLFGMKEARSRISTAKGTNRNHAYYDTWESSVYDYAFYQCRYLSAIGTEAQYYSYLSGSYAEDPHYVAKVRKLAEKLKEKF
jgi:flagellum-specific peptidoglycan hydrolase FlgJ